MRMRYPYHLNIGPADSPVGSCEQRRINRTPYSPIRGGTLSQGPKIQSRHHLAPIESFDSPKLKYEALEISEVRGPLKEKCLCITIILGPFESKVCTHCNYCWGPLETNVPYLGHSLQFLLGPFESKLLYTLQLQRGARSSASLAFP